MDERDFWLLLLVGAFTYALVALAQRVTYLEQDMDRLTVLPLPTRPGPLPLYDADRRQASDPIDR